MFSELLILFGLPNMSVYTPEELERLGLRAFGKNVRISRKASLYNPTQISIGDHVRIDDFCVLSAGVGGIEIGNYIHVAVYSALIGAGRIRVMDFANLSSRVTVYSSNDDYSGMYMTNPMVPVEHTNVSSQPVDIGKHVIIGSGSIVLPGCDLQQGVAIGSLSLVKGRCDEFGVYAGVPAKRISERRRDLLAHEKLLKQSA